MQLIPLMLLVGLPSQAQFRSITDPIRVEAGATSQVRVLSADIREQITGTWGDLKIQNVSTSSVDLLIYAEYLNDGARVCFTMAFSSGHNVGDKGPIQPQQIRELRAYNASLDPATQPTSVRLRIIQGSPGQFSPAADLMDFVAAPATLLGGGSPLGTSVRLRPDVFRNNDVPLEIALAEVDVDEKGTVQNVSVVKSIDPEVTKWISSYLHSTAYYPPVENGIPTLGRLLVLAEVVSPRLLKENACPPRLSTWVKQDPDLGLDGGSYLPITTLLLKRPPTQIKRIGGHRSISVPAAPPGVFELIAIGSEWGAQGFGFESDSSMPDGMRRIPLSATDH